MFRFSIRQFGYNGDGTVSAKYQLYLQTSLNQFIPLKLCNTLDEAKTGAEDFINATLAAGIGWVDATLASGSTVFVPFNEGDEPPLSDSLIASVTFTPLGTITNVGAQIGIRLTFNNSISVVTPQDMYVHFVAGEIQEGVPEGYFYYSDHGNNYIDFVYTLKNTGGLNNLELDLLDFYFDGSGLTIGEEVLGFQITEFPPYTSPSINLNPSTITAIAFDSLAEANLGNPTMDVAITLSKNITNITNPELMVLTCDVDGGGSGLFGYVSHSGNQIFFTFTLTGSSLNSTGTQFSFGNISIPQETTITFAGGDVVNEDNIYVPGGVTYTRPTINYQQVVNPSSIIESMTFTPSGTITGPGRSVILRIVFKDDMILSNPNNMYVTFTMDNENIEDYFYYSDHGEVEPAGADYIDFIFVTYNTTEYNFPFELVSLSLSGASLSLGGVAQPSTITDFSNYTSPTMNITPIVFVGAVFDSLATVTAGNPNMTVVITLPKAIQAVANPQNINLQFSGTNGNQGFLNYSSFSGSQMTFTRTIPNGNSDTTAEDFTFGSITPFSTGKITFVDGDFVDSTGEIAPQAGLLYDAPTIAY